MGRLNITVLIQNWIKVVIRSNIQFEIFCTTLHLLVPGQVKSSLFTCIEEMSLSLAVCTHCNRPGPEVINLFFMLNSTEGEISTAH